MLFRVVQEFLTRVQIPFTPGRDNTDIRVERVSAELKANLIVTLTGRTVRDSISASLSSDLNQPLGDQRARDGSSEEILPLINRVGAEHREHEITNKLFANVFNVDFLNAQGLSFGSRRLELFTLPQIGCEGDDFAAVFLSEPFEDDGSIQPA